MREKGSLLDPSLLDPRRADRLAPLKGLQLRQ